MDDSSTVHLGIRAALGIAELDIAALRIVADLEIVADSKIVIVQRAGEEPRAEQAPFGQANRRVRNDEAVRRVPFGRFPWTFLTHAVRFCDSKPPL